MKLNTITQKAIHILVYGPPKVGKTRLVGQLAKAGFNLKFFDLENGFLTLTNSIPQEFQDNVEVYKIPDTKDFPIAIETCLKVIKPAAVKICDTHGKVECPTCKLKKEATFSEFDSTKLGPKDIVVFDSLTQLSNSAMSNIGKDQSDLWKPEWEHYRSQGAMLDRFLSTIQNAPWNCICITHEAMVETVAGKDDKNSKTEKIVPVAGTANFSRNTAKYFDEVVYCTVENLKHRAASSTTYAPNILTGSRSATRIETMSGEDLSLLPIFENQMLVTTADKAKEALTKIQSEIKK